jgi:hypothetical protein
MLRKAAAQLHREGLADVAAHVLTLIPLADGTPAAAGGRIPARSWRDVRLRVDTDEEPAGLEYGIARGKLRRLTPVPRQALRALMASDGEARVDTGCVGRADAHALRVLLRRLFSAPGDPLAPDRAGHYVVGWRWHRPVGQREVPMTDVASGMDADDLEATGGSGSPRRRVTSARSQRRRPDERG